MGSILGSTRNICRIRRIDPAMITTVAPEQPPKVITIDGPAGSGKSTVSRMLAHRLGWIYVTTGAIYRTLALMLFEAGTGVQDRGSIERFVAFLSERYRQDPRSGRVFLGDREITHEIRTPFVSEQASLVAQDELVRRRLLPVQRKVVLDCNGAVVDGRDMGTVVFPDAPLKIFLTASPEQRAQRRMDELRAQNLEPSLDELIREIHERDARDSNRLVAPMRAAEDAVLLDSTELEPNAVVKAILRLCVDRGLVPGLEES
ncbi:MAG: (d)CMP kinase [Betaproteobacteria bacterium]|nr:(d)CMP kinase [Betaproteobacteria bacterium]